MQKLYDQGGRKFWIHNTGPLGCLPQKLSLVKNNALDHYGCISSYNDAARLFNEGLRHLCQEMRSELNGATIVYVDIFSIKYDLIANSTKYGKPNCLYSLLSWWSSYLESLFIKSCCILSNLTFKSFLRWIISIIISWTFPWTDSWRLPSCHFTELLWLISLLHAFVLSDFSLWTNLYTIKP